MSNFVRPFSHRQLYRMYGRWVFVGFDTDGQRGQ